jgi:hypothetical protein
MKKIIAITILVAGSLIGTRSNAQVSAHVSINIGVQPVWGPVGYDYVNYYYLPDIDVYYCVPRHEFVYLDGGRWIFAASLPPRYHDYDLYNSYKVVINDRRPYLHDDMYREKYASFRGRHDQAIIRDSHDSKYFVVKGHPEHDKWEREHHQHNDHNH